MTVSQLAASREKGRENQLRTRMRTAAVWFYVAVLAWAPFPLGGAVSWGAGLQALLIAVCWMLWGLSNWGHLDEVWLDLRRVIFPLGITLVVLLWCVLQTLPIFPTSWVHPVWAMASDALGRPVAGVISLNPWRTEAEILKLSSYIAACWLAFSIGREAKSASLLLNSVIMCGVIYALYAIALSFTSTNQAQLFYLTSVPLTYISGPFMLHNSFATYCGLCTLAAVAKLVDQGSRSIVIGRSARTFALTTIQFIGGAGAPILIAALLSFSAVVISESRAGLVATICGLVALGVLSLLVIPRGTVRFQASIGALAVALPVVLFVVTNSGALGNRFNELLDAGTADDVRLALWGAAQRMIAGAPWLGLGLGTFQDAYPLFATHVLPFVMDKAHCDYLEFAAGIGIPAAVAWWFAMGWVNYLCFRGVEIRRRDRIYSVVALGASVLVAVHSSVDFSLQLPAVGLLYATLLGVGVAQAVPTRSVT